MKKIGVLVFILLSLNFVSAYYYSTGAFGDFLDGLDPAVVILGVIFIVSFAFLNFSLVKMLKGNKATAGIIALCLALLLTYVAHSSGIDYNSFVYDFGIDLSNLDNVVFLVSLALFVFIGIKGGFGLAMVILGVGWILVGFSDLVKSYMLFLTFGCILLIIGAILAPKTKKKSKQKAKNAREFFRNLFESF